MDRDKETLGTWNKLATLYEEKFMHLNLYDETYDYFCTTLQNNNPRILEIGCGPGNITKYLLSKRPDFAIDGIDFAANMIELAKKNNPEANFTVMDTRQIDTITTRFDAVISGFCLPYLSQPEASKLIFDCKNILTEEGILYLSFVAGDPKESGYQLSSTGDSVYFHYHSLTQLEMELSASHFEPLKLFHINYQRSEEKAEVHTILIAKKNA